MESSPMGHGAKERGPPPLGGPPLLPLGIVPHGKLTEVAPSLAYIRRGRVPFYSYQLFSLSSSFLLPRVDSPCLDATLGWGFLYHTHVVVLLESGSESIFFPLLFWFGAWRDVRYTVCV